MELTAAQLNLRYLMDEELENPENELTAFFDCFGLDGAKEELNKLKPVNMDDDTAYFFERLEKLMEAAWVMR
jgi:hypothetical protein